MNEQMLVRCVDISQEGEGITKSEGGYTVFVPNILPGEKAYVNLVKKGERFGRGEILNLLEESPFRIEPYCPVFYECGGCQLQHLQYKEQLSWKEKKVRDSLERIAGIVNPKINPIIGMEDPWNYRNRGQFVVGEKDGDLRYGFFSSKSHSLVAFNECPIHHKFINETLQNLVPQLKDLRSYFEGNGTLRHISVRCGENTGEVLATLVTTEPIPKKIKLDLSKITRTVGIVENINKTKGSRVLGEKENLLLGRAYLTEIILGLKFNISSQSFFQNNTKQTEKLYSKVIEYVKPQGKKILDLYSGIGTITLTLAKEAKEVVGVEIVKAAVRDAEINAKINNIQNVRFHALDVKDAFKQERIAPDVLVVDPPRKGVDQRVLNAIKELNPKTIVYVSCNPDTLARDINLLKDKYEFIEATPIDLFPHTTHVETVCLMSRK